MDKVINLRFVRSETEPNYLSLRAVGNMNIHQMVSVFAREHNIEPGDVATFELVEVKKADG